MYINPVQFEDENYKAKGRHIIKNRNESELVQYLIDKGWLKSKTVASIVLIIISIAFMLMSAYFFTGGKAFGFISNSSSRIADEPYYINIPGVDEPVEVLPGEDLGEVLKKYRN